ncbi:bifunctional 4-hydroxy-2-oxoglutarate aldolase/2-dehydro-3-deoxy-phosphogluconate aldolase [Halobacillus shinanisalinarum]|uniref:Bifunctional 4-hydroxy-2-oxoglutarate aldolase/2-dehydro-3-deoxy-phosphogluconate aldolase n=1 Tax=Halobacillus shinanisalinarum TaxID=2932258 RepID=A0ABY4H2P7_9BACI|nr:bifunctional 4-hydroxy-2-oxoglutarate aldolase/2-dehydro-3-deoxy-phosphogluconate aldolase [Halobacillus shinanisalinarum]UOQ94703.1 bifunctional 4-hydroxy-2-oxoglutarate aldolase/2-dehydro-3-deoxy-phosphogluconate aldolase [Halobacillus shinanisalinarum]
MSHYTTLDKLLSSGIVAVVRKVESDKVESLVQALVKGGVSGIEITMDSDDSANTIHELKQRHGNEAVIGAGTVFNKEQAKEAIAAGADFVFAPILDKETIEYTKDQGVIMIPGVFTPTEIYQAYHWGSDMVKVFPASVLGPQFFKDVNGPLDQIPKMPTGGVNLENIGSFIKAGAIGAGIGGSLVNKSLIEKENWPELQELAQKYVEEVARVRQVVISQETQV